jgi:hypothetical protein
MVPWIVFIYIDWLDSFRRISTEMEASSMQDVKNSSSVLVLFEWFVILHFHIWFNFHCIYYYIVLFLVGVHGNGPALQHSFSANDQWFPLITAHNKSVKSNFSGTKGGMDKKRRRKGTSSTNRVMSLSVQGLQLKRLTIYIIITHRPGKNFSRPSIWKPENASKKQWTKKRR